MQGQVHLRERLLEVLDPHRRAFDQALAVALLSLCELFWLLATFGERVLRACEPERLALGASHALGLVRL
jgi:hypothetical protein